MLRIHDSIVNLTASRQRNVAWSPENYVRTRLAMPQYAGRLCGANLGQFERQTMPIYANSTIVRRWRSSVQLVAAKEKSRSTEAH